MNSLKEEPLKSKVSRIQYSANLRNAISEQVERMMKRSEAIGRLRELEETLSYPGIPEHLKISCEVKINNIKEDYGIR